MTTALIVIDIQNDYFPGGKMELTNPEKAAQNAAQLIEKFRQDSAPIFHIQHITEGNAVPFFIPETEGVEIHSSVKPLDNEPVIIKHTPNSFFNTNLEEKLKQAGVTDLVIVGMMTHMCIDATVRSAMEHGYKVKLANDACATTDLPIGNTTVAAEDVHNAFMAALNGMYAEVVDTKNII
ncbi:cysteine hydrolase family protein [Macrococcus animalis]|uniref:cysteine hydrolase family protein n=1 Tax=Macrococcus animalis TaxID=3395467 RepID=UPI0039BEBBC9